MDCANTTTYTNVLPEVCHACGESREKGAFRFFVRTNKTTGRGYCYPCSYAGAIASNTSIFDAKSFTEEIAKYCKGKRFVGMDNKSYSCDTTAQIQVSTPVLGGLFDSELDKLCRACGNRSVDEKTGKTVSTERIYIE